MIVFGCVCKIAHNGWVLLSGVAFDAMSDPNRGWLKKQM